jgi:hypothetical protein
MILAKYQLIMTKYVDVIFNIEFWKVDILQYRMEG